MDVIALAFYACVCAALSVLAPRLGTFTLRLGVGAAVGILAAMVLPLLRGLIGA